MLQSLTSWVLWSPEVTHTHTHPHTHAHTPTHAHTHTHTRTHTLLQYHIVHEQYTVRWKQDVATVLAKIRCPPLAPSPTHTHPHPVSWLFNGVSTFPYNTVSEVRTCVYSVCVRVCDCNHAQRGGILWPLHSYVSSSTSIIPSSCLLSPFHQVSMSEVQSHPFSAEIIRKASGPNKNWKGQSSCKTKKGFLF